MDLLLLVIASALRQHKGASQCGTNLGADEIPSASVYYEVSTNGKLPAADNDDIKALTQRHINVDAIKDNVFGEAR